MTRLHLKTRESNDIHSKNVYKLVFIFLIVSILMSDVSASSYGPPPGYPSQPPPPQQYSQSSNNPNDPYSQQRPTGSSQPPQGYNQYPPGYGPPPPSSQQQQQQQQRPPGQYSMTPYGRNQNPADNGAGGFFSKLKSSIFAAGSALAGSETFQPPNEPRRPAGPPAYGNTPGRSQPGSIRPPSPPVHSSRPPGPGGFDRSFPSRQQTPQEEGSGLLNKIKNFFSGDEEGRPSDQMRRPTPPGLPGHFPGSRPPPGYPSGSFQTPQSTSQLYDYPPTNTPPPPPPPTQPSSPFPGFDDRYPPQPQQQQQQQQQQPSFQPWGEEPNIQDLPYGSSSSSDYNYPPVQSSMQSPQNLPPSSYPGGNEPQMSNYYNFENTPSGSSNSGASGSFQDQYPGYSDPNSQFNPQMIPQGIVQPEIPPEPQIFVIEDCIVLIPRPQEFYKKKSEITQMGPQSLQVFTDFEKCLTKFRTEEGEKSMSTAELLESSSLLMPAALQNIKDIIENFASMGQQGNSYEGEEKYTAEREAVIARDGQLYIGNIAPATRDMIPKMPMRFGWKEIFHSLAFKGVPTYVFSDGYGDIVHQALLQGASFEGGVLPQNVRIISNMFRTAPDGTVRAFSQPIVHSRNKNVTTASHVMGFPVPNRPYALLIGSHEQDLNMLDGIEGLKDKITLGLLEMTTDLVDRLPNYLNSYDAIVLGDGSLQYAKTLVDDLLDQAGSSSSNTGSQDRGFGGLVGALKKKTPFQGDFFIA